MSSAPKPALQLNELTRRIIGAAMEVHSALGPGLLENAYRICLVHALRQQGFKVETEVAKPIEFRGVKLDAGFRIDMLVEDSVIVEIKACERTLPVHEAQLL